MVFVCVQIGDLQSSYTAAQKSEDTFPEHVDTQQLLKQLRQHFAVLWASTWHGNQQMAVSLYLCLFIKWYISSGYSTSFNISVVIIVCDFC